MSRPRRPTVAFLTDYGPGSEHVGALHAVVAGACPEADRIDLAHDLPPGDVRAGAVVLARTAPLLPGAVHLAVVDPGVGTGRPAVAVALRGGGALVGPDNGLLGPAASAMGPRAAVDLRVPPGIPATFHGRDLFAPAAARLAAGEPLAALGPARDPGTLAMPDLPAAEATPGRLRAIAVAADRFGNLQLLAGADDLARAGLAPGDAVEVGAEGGSGRHRGVVARAFADVPEGALLVHLDAHGRVAVAVNRGDATAHLGAGPGAQVAIRRLPEGGLEPPGLEVE